MKFTCVSCGYKTNSLQSWNRHRERKTPCSGEKTLEYPCLACGRKFGTLAFLSNHIRKATTTDGMKCISRPEKSQRLESRGSTNESVSATNAAGTGDDAPQPADTVNVNTFGNEDLEAVVQVIVNDPSRFQMAIQEGSLHVELCIATHFGDIQQNNNIVSIELKAAVMRVLNGGPDPVRMDKAEGLRRIIANNEFIVRQRQVVELLSSADILKATSETPKEIARAIQCKGKVWRSSTSVFKKGPPSRSELGQLLDDSFMDDFADDLSAFVNGERDCFFIVPYALKTVGRTTVAHQGQWWRAFGAHDGWIIVSFAHVKQNVAECLGELLEGIKDREAIGSVDTISDYTPVFVDTVCNALREHCRSTRLDNVFFFD